MIVNVRKIRMKKGLTQESLSIAAKVGRSTISEIETGKYVPGVDIALLISHALSSTVEELFILEGGF